MKTKVKPIEVELKTSKESSFTPTSITNYESLFVPDTSTTENILTTKLAESDKYFHTEERLKKKVIELKTVILHNNERADGKKVHGDSQEQAGTKRCSLVAPLRGTEC